MRKWNVTILGKKSTATAEGRIVKQTKRQTEETACINPLKVYSDCTSALKGLAATQTDCQQIPAGPNVVQNHAKISKEAKKSMSIKQRTRSNN